MKSIKKIVWITISVIALAATTACSTTDKINLNSQEVAGAASKIADFDLPDGYTADFTASLMGYSIAAFNPGDGNSHLYLIQSENEADGEKLAEMLEQLAPGTTDSQPEMTILESRTVTLRGEEAKLLISEGFNHENVNYRQATAAFHGKGGPALLVLSEPVNQWNPETLESLLTSIR